MPSALRLFRDTAIALLAPRRLVPIVLVCVPMVAAQARFSRTGEATAIAVLMCVVFVAVSPFAWRALFPRGGSRRLWGLRLLAYGALGGLPGLLGWAVPEFFDLGETFLTWGVNLAVSTALFWVGGWGLARDVDQEEGLAEARRRAEAFAREAERAQLLALRAQLDPHVLFNTLNAIAEWCRVDPLIAERAVLDLAALLRRIQEGSRAPAWSLDREIGLVRALWALHAIRDPERFVSDWDLPDPIPMVDVPPLLLLPLAENAVTHGPARGATGPLRLRIVPGEPLGIEISNPGLPGPPRPEGQGLDTVRRRLALAWGAGAGLDLAPDGDRTVVRVRIPSRAMEGPA